MRQEKQPMKNLWVLVALACVLGCQGTVERNKAPGGGDPFAPSGTGASPGVHPGTGGSKPGTAVGTDPDDPRIAQRIWRLTSTQFNAEVERLFGSGAPQVSIPETAAEDGITNIAANAVVDLGNA